MDRRPLEVTALSKLQNVLKHEEREEKRERKNLKWENEKELQSPNENILTHSIAKAPLPLSFSLQTFWTFNYES